MFLRPKTFSETGYQRPEHGARRSTMSKAIFATAAAILFFFAASTGISLLFSDEAENGELMSKGLESVTPLQVEKQKPAMLVDELIVSTIRSPRSRIIAFAGMVTVVLLVAIVVAITVFSKSNQSAEAMNDLSPTQSALKQNEKVSKVNGGSNTTGPLRSHGTSTMTPTEHESWWEGGYLGFIGIGGIIFIMTIVAGVVILKMPSKLPQQKGFNQKRADTPMVSEITKADDEKVESTGDPHKVDDGSDVLEEDGALRHSLAASYKHTEWEFLDRKGFNDVQELLRVVQNNMKIVLDKARHRWPKLTDAKSRNFKIYILNFYDGEFRSPEPWIQDTLITFGRPAELYFYLLKLYNIMPHYFFIKDHMRKLTLDEFKVPEIYVFPFDAFFYHEDNLEKLQESYLYVCRLAAEVDSLIDHTR